MADESEPFSKQEDKNITKTSVWMVRMMVRDRGEVFGVNGLWEYRSRVCCTSSVMEFRIVNFFEGR
jgi:hypothetical protein